MAKTNPIKIQKKVFQSGFENFQLCKKKKKKKKKKFLVMHFLIVDFVFHIF